MLPRVAVVDPELTLSLPPEVTAYTGMDALTQLIEPFVSNAASPFTDGVCREGLTRAARSLEVAYRDGSDLAAREDMALCSLFGGVALANAKLGAVHGVAGVVGGMVDAPHGAVCAALLAPVVEANVRALRGRDPDSPALDRYTTVARLLTGRDDATVEDGVAWLRDTVAALQVPALGTVGLSVNLTPLLSVTSQLVIIALMLIGRVGPITLFAALVLRQHDRLYRHPEERPIIG